MRGLKCHCGQLLVSVYVADTSLKNKNKKSIGLFCLNCETVRHPTKFLSDKKQDIQKTRKREQEYKITPKSNPKFKDRERCSECRAMRGIKIIKHQEKLHIEFDKERQQFTCQGNNPYIECKCTKCDHYWHTSIEMPYGPKYLLPTKMTKEKLRLAFQRIGSKKIKIPQRLKKMAMEIHRELEQERKAKEARDLDELLGKH